MLLNEQQMSAYKSHIIRTFLNDILSSGGKSPLTPTTPLSPPSM